MTELLGDLEAHRLLCRAYGSSYRWPQDFGGFRASVYYAHDQEHRTGSLEVHTPSESGSRMGWRAPMLGLSGNSSPSWATAGIYPTRRPMAATGSPWMAASTR